MNQIVGVRMECCLCSRAGGGQGRKGSDGKCTNISKKNIGNDVSQNFVTQLFGPEGVLPKIERFWGSADIFQFGKGSSKLKGLGNTALVKYFHFLAAVAEWSKASVK